ncbi:MAG: hypothetical protein ACI9IA_001730, partial [Enterobacterales bacterium]
SQMLSYAKQGIREIIDIQQTALSAG